jgi:Na+-translocating ferredoxin:NAD+ oxidoreductase RnfD subunit
MNLKIKLAYPLQLVALSTYIIYGYYNAKLLRLGLSQWAVSVGTGFFATYLVNRFIPNRKMSYMSTLIASTALFLLLTSLEWYGYAIASATMVLGKLLVTNENKHHVFNPAGFALLICICLFPNTLILNSKQFIDSYWLLGLILGLGAAIVILSDRYLISLSYIAGFAVASYIRSLVSPEAFVFFFYPFLNPMNLIFIFHMISDPATTPSTRREQLILGFIIALIDHLLRHFWVFYSPLIALLLVRSIYYLMFGTFKAKGLNELCSEAVRKN